MRQELCKVKELGNSTGVWARDGVSNKDTVPVHWHSSHR